MCERRRHTTRRLHTHAWTTSAYFEMKGATIERVGWTESESGVEDEVAGNPVDAAEPGAVLEGVRHRAGDVFLSAPSRDESKMRDSPTLVDALETEQATFLHDSLADFPPLIFDGVAQGGEQGQLLVL